MSSTVLHRPAGAPAPRRRRLMGHGSPYRAPTMHPAQRTRHIGLNRCEQPLLSLITPLASSERRCLVDTAYSGPLCLTATSTRQDDQDVGQSSPPRSQGDLHRIRALSRFKLVRDFQLGQLSQCIEPERRGAGEAHRRPERFACAHARCAPRFVLRTRHRGPPHRSRRQGTGTHGAGVVGPEPREQGER